MKELYINMLSNLCQRLLVEASWGRKFQSEFWWVNFYWKE